MIRLTRLRNPNPLYLNPDLIERLDSHHETTVHLSNGSEYVVTEQADQIVRMITEQRAGVLALALRLERDLPVPAITPRLLAGDVEDEVVAPDEVADDAAAAVADDDGDAPWRPSPTGGVDLADPARGGR